MTDWEAARQQRLKDVCERKRHFRSKAKAREVAAQVRKAHGNSVFLYKCPVCNRWLLTSEPQKTSDVTRASRGHRAPIKPRPERGTHDT